MQAFRALNGLAGVSMLALATAALPGLSSVARAQSPGGDPGQYCQTEFSDRTFCMADNYALEFQPVVVTTVTQTENSTRILGRLDGGMPLFDEVFPAAFLDPVTQAGVAAARAAITTAGGPGVIVGDPVLIDRQVTSVTETGAVTYQYNGGGRNDDLVTTLTNGEPGVTVAVGDLSGCDALIASIGNAVQTSRPACTPMPITFPVEQGSINELTTFTGVYFIDQYRTDTFTETVSETYELTGHVVPVGTIHVAVQSGLFDLASRLLRRLPDVERGLWGEPYYLHVRQTGSRETWGLGGGYAFDAAPGLSLGFALDHGWQDLAAPGALETGELRLTQLGAAARLQRGPFGAALAAVYGFGSADTTRGMVGTSEASYDVSVAGAVLDLGYTLTTGAVRITPAAGFDYVSIHSDAFTETDTLGLVASHHGADRLRGSAGLGIATDLGVVGLSASARYVAVLDGEERVLPVAFTAAPGVPLTMRGISEPDTAQLGAAARVALGASAALTLGYDGRFGEGYTQHAAVAAINLSW